MPQSLTEQLEHLPSHMLKALLENTAIRAEVKEIAAELLAKAVSVEKHAEPGPLTASVTTATLHAPVSLSANSGVTLVASEPVAALEPEPEKAEEAQ